MLVISGEGPGVDPENVVVNLFTAAFAGTGDGACVRVVAFPLGPLAVQNG